MSNQLKDKKAGLLQGVPDHIRTSLIDMMNKIDNVETIVNLLQNFQMQDIKSSVCFKDICFKLICQ
jgi:hypothetical protein